MAERIELPGTFQGTAEEKLQQMYSYLYRMATAMNANLAEIGPVALTDSEMLLMNQLNTEKPTDAMPNTGSHAWQEAETLKSLIIKTATIVKTAIDAYRLAVFGETEAQSDIGTFLQRQGLKVDITPEGIKQTYSFAEVVKGLKNYEINAKNYIKTGLLRTEQSIPIYGVAVGKDIVEFLEDGTEIYKDENKVAEFTAEAMTFYSDGYKTAEYTDNKITFYNGGQEVFYVQQGALHTVGDMIIDAEHGKVAVGNWVFKDNEIIYGLYGSPYMKLIATTSDVQTSMHGVNYGDLEVDGGGGSFHFEAYQPRTRAHEDPPIYSQFYCENYNGAYLGTAANTWSEGNIDDVYYYTLHQLSSRKYKKNIRKIASIGERLDKLRPVTFIYKNDPDGKTRHGLIWEETIDVMPEICAEKDERRSIDYTELVPMLLREIQELRARVKALEEKEE